VVITVRVQPRASRPGVERMGEREFRVRVSAAPDRGRANEEVIERLADHLGLPKSRLRILRGQASRMKTVEVDGCEHL
jgi:uncharacterized protein (TIGR00251 family)